MLGFKRCQFLGRETRAHARFIRCDQFLARGRIHAVVAGRNRRRAADAHVHFRRTRFAHHAHDLAAGRAAHDRIVHEHDALAAQKFRHGIELQLHAEIADRLLRLDERAAHIMVADEAHAKRHAGFLRISYRGGHARIGHGHDDVGRNVVFARQHAAQHFAALLDHAAEHETVRAVRNKHARKCIVAAAFRAAKRRDSIPALARCAAFLRARCRARTLRRSNRTRTFPKRRPRRRRAARARAGGIRGDRAARTFRRASAPAANRRLPLDSAHRRARSERFRAWLRAMRCTMTSVSLVVWKIEPRCSSVRRNRAALGKLPLWPSASFPLLQSMTIGCAFMSEVSPAVE